MVTLTTLAQSWNNSTTLWGTHFEKENATFVAEHNIISAIVLCIHICDLNVSN